MVSARSAAAQGCGAFIPKREIKNITAIFIPILREGARAAVGFLGFVRGDFLEKRVGYNSSG